MDIKLLPKDLPPLFSFQTSELGKLYCFTLRPKDWTQLSRKQTESLNDSDWVRALASISCNKEKSLKDGQYKPDDSDLLDDEVARINQSELEDFAIKFADSAPFLKKLKDDDDQKQKDDESNATYLRRIYNHHHSNLATTKMSKEIEKSLLGSKSAFESLSQQLKSLSSSAKATDILSANTLAGIAKLREQENALERNWQPLLSHTPHIPSPPQITAAQKSELHLEALKNLMLASNEVQAGIRKDITNAIADSKNKSRWNLIISGSVLILTLAGLSLTYWVAQSSSEQMNTFMERMGENSSAIAKPLDALNSSVNRANDNDAKLTQAIESLGAEVKLLRQEQQTQKAMQKNEAEVTLPVQKVQ